MTTPTKNVSTLFLKASIIGIVLIVIVACAFVLPQLWIAVPVFLPTYLWVVYLGLFTFSLTLLPFLCALYQGFLLLRYIDTQQAFSEKSVKALRNITRAAIAMSVLYWLSMPVVYLIAEFDDAPGLVVMGSAFACAPLVVATFAAVLKKLVVYALYLQMENNLTV